MMIKMYDQKSSWFAYQMAVRQTLSNVDMYDDDLKSENLYPAI